MTTSETKSAATKTAPTPRAEAIIGFIDYGCAFAHRKFREPSQSKEWSTRVLAIWDQSMRSIEMSGDGRPELAWRTPSRFRYGHEVWREDTPGIPAGSTNILSLDAFVQKFQFGDIIDEIACYRHAAYPAIEAPVTHGTFVMDLAAGYPDPLREPGESETPPNTDLVFVQLPRFFDGVQVSGMLRTYVLDAIRYIFDCSIAQDGKPLPVTINLSYGANGGPHDGSSILEAAIDEAIQLRREAKGVTNIVIAAGNSRTQVSQPLGSHPPDSLAQIHAFARIEPKGSTSFVWQNIPANPTIQYVEIWIDEESGAPKPCGVRVTLPGLQPSDWLAPGRQQAFVAGDREVIAMLIAHTKVYQSTKGRMVLLAVGPTISVKNCEPAPYGDWIIEVKSTSENPVLVNAWCERDEPVFGSDSGPRQARFRPGPTTVDTGNLNGIAHGEKTIVVGGYVGGSLQPADYSSIGPGRNLSGQDRNGTGLSGPQWFAPCEESEALPGLMGAKVLGNDMIRLNGTSAAAARATRYINDQVGQRPTLTVPGKGPNGLPFVPYV